ncbi:MAG: 3-oxoacyl-ACP reductase FabG [Thermodesulfobacteriota bacterium]
MTTFLDKKIIVSGATRGIGKGISRAFLEGGGTVIGLYGGNHQAADDFAAEHSNFKDNFSLHKCDVTDENAVNTLFAEIEAKYDTIDILVNNAGIRRDALVAMMDSKNWQDVIDTNLSGTFLLSRQAVMLMLKQKYGRIINITSPMAHLGFPGQANYAASKAGQIGFAKTLAREVARKKITVNCVSPGFIATDLLDGLTDEQLKAYKKLVPMRRFGKVEEVADAVLYLASDRASYITGAVLEVNGGL